MGFALGGALRRSADLVVGLTHDLGRTSALLEVAGSSMGLPEGTRDARNSNYCR